MVNTIPGREATARLRRNGGIELLRVIAMSLIVIWHFQLHGGGFDAVPWTRVLGPVTNVAVPLFVAISGYFGIRSGWRPVVRLAVIVLLFEAADLAAVYLYKGNVNLGDYWWRAFTQPLTNSGYWFVNSYFALMLVSPLLNKGLEAMSRFELRRLALVLLIVDAIFFWIPERTQAGIGYNAYYFVLLYVWGAWARREEWLARQSNGRLVTLLALALALNIASHCFMILRWTPQGLLFDSTIGFNWMACRYTNPFLVTEAVLLLALFSRFDLRSRIVHMLAGASFGVYLVQEGFSGSHIYAWSRHMLGTQSAAICTLMFAVQFAVLWICSLILTFFARKLLSMFVNYKK